DLVEVRGLDGISSGRVGSLRVRGGELEWSGDWSGPQDAGGAGSPGLVFGEVAIEGLRVRIPSSAALPAGVSFTINTSLKSIGLGEVAGAVAREKQFVEFEDVAIRSPLDPLATVLSIRALGCEFTLAGLAAREIELLTITSPTLHVGEDLFWYMDAREAGAEGVDWKVRRVIVVDGRLLIGSGGSSALGLPLRFRSTASDVSLGSLASLRADLTLEIPSRDYEFPSYELEFTTSAGELRLAYPPATGAKNLVGTVRMPSIRWRQFQASDGWVTVTFDRKGINGRFGTAFYRGYLNGGFSFLFHPETPWIGWVAGTRLDLRRLTRAIAPDRFLMSGRLGFQAAVDASGAEVRRVKGSLVAASGGRVEIPKLDELLAAIPSDWPALRQSGAELALRTLRDFDFESGKGEFWFAGGRGRLGLELRGPAGSRKVDVVLHGDSSAREATKPRR
ncbi:MAG: hypothetical protein N2322_02750, partial [Terrimicrobiaceae bacterium]|nr:hypothetical protein [Terrimicrobiaceae bacterium]